MNSVTHFKRVNSELQSMVIPTILQWILILDSLDLCPFCKFKKKGFHLLLRCQSVLINFFLKLTSPCWVNKMSYINFLSWSNLIGTARIRRLKSTTFSVDVTRLCPPPVFEDRGMVPEPPKQHFVQLLSQTQNPTSTPAGLTMALMNSQNLDAILCEPCSYMYYDSVFVPNDFRRNFRTSYSIDLPSLPWLYMHEHTSDMIKPPSENLGYTPATIKSRS